MAAHVRLKNAFTEDGKCHNLMSWLIHLSRNFVLQDDVMHEDRLSCQYEAAKAYPNCVSKFSRRSLLI